VCGKQNSIRFYHPETFDNDVTIFHKVGRGRGKGFEKILGFSLEEFPELRETLGNRVLRVSAFLNPQPEATTEIVELKLQLEIAEMKRMKAEDELEELDLELLLHKIGSQLGTGHSDIHAAIDELIARNRNLGNANRNMNTVHQNLEVSRLRLDQEKKNLESENTRLEKENNELVKITHDWAESQKKLETQHRGQIHELSNALTQKNNRLVKVEEELEELDLGMLIHKIQIETQRRFTNIHAGIGELIRMKDVLDQEQSEALEFINDILPERYDLYYDLGEALAAMYQYYEDEIEELSDE